MNKPVAFIEVTEKEIVKLQEVLKRKPTKKLKRRIEFLQKLLKESLTSQA